MPKDKFSDYDATPANNTDIGGINITGGAAVSNMDDALREQMSQIAEHHARDTIASAGTTDLGSKAARYLSITGTTTITSFGTVKAGTVKEVVFAGALTLTHNATSLILPGAANIATAAGDIAVCYSEGSGNWRVTYHRASSGYSGALVSLSANQSIATGTNTNVVWATEDVDVGNWFNPGALTRFTVPSGITRVQLTAGIRWDLVAAGNRFVEFRKNGNQFVGSGSSYVAGISAGSVQNVVSAVVSATAGDYFEVRVFQDRGASLDIISSQNTFFGIQGFRA